VKAFVVTAPGRYGLVTVPDPVAGPGEILVAPIAVGICGSDLEILGGQRPGEYVRYPIVPGHEWVGRVVECGPGVGGVAPGSLVVAEGVRSCGVCDRCSEGRTNLCAGLYAETGFTHPGALAERVVVPAGQTHVLPPGWPTASAALIEPAACVATGLLEVGQPVPGSRIAVVGDGPLGLLAVALLRITTPAELLLIGSRRQRLACGIPLGATGTALSAELAHERLDSRFDLVVEATNSPSGAAVAIGLARRAGTVLLLGISGGGVPTVDADRITLGHLRVQGVFAASRAAWRWLVSLYGAGLFDPGLIITHRFSLDKVEEAFAVLSDREAGALKVIVEPNPG